MESSIIAYELDMQRIEQITKLIKSAMDVGIMFIICILVAGCFVYYLWKIKPKLEESKQMIIENNQKIADGLAEVESLVTNTTVITDKLKNSVDSLNTSIVINNDKVTMINAEILLLKQDMESLKLIVNDLKYEISKR